MFPKYIKHYAFLENVCMVLQKADLLEVIAEYYISVFDELNGNS